MCDLCMEGSRVSNVCMQGGRMCDLLYVGWQRIWMSAVHRVSDG